MFFFLKENLNSVHHVIYVEGLLKTIFSSQEPVEQPCMVQHIKYINSIVSPLLTFSHNNAIFPPSI